MNRSQGRWYSAKYDYLSLPMMVKEGSVIALGARDDRPDYDYADGADIRMEGNDTVVTPRAARMVVNC